MPKDDLKTLISVDTDILPKEGISAERVYFCQEKVFLPIVYLSDDDYAILLHHSAVVSAQNLV